MMAHAHNEILTRGNQICDTAEEITDFGSWNGEMISEGGLPQRMIKWLAKADFYKESIIFFVNLVLHFAVLHIISILLFPQKLESFNTT